MFTLWCIYVVWRWLFPGKEGRAQRRNLKKKQKLGMLFPSPHPRNDGIELRQGIDFKMGGILQWKKVKGGQLLRYKPAIKDVTASVLFWNREDLVQAGNRLPFRLHVADIGVLCINAPQEGVFEACVKDGELSSGDALVLLHTDKHYIEAWKIERERLRAEEAAKKEEERQRRRAEDAKKEAERARLRQEQYLKFIEEERELISTPAYQARLQAERKEREEREKAEIASKLKERQRRRELEKQVRLELIDSGELFGDEAKRPPIPRDVVDAVYRRDGARCVYCGSTENLQLDHIIPFSKGGATSLENLQLLCQKCNLEKSNKIG